MHVCNIGAFTINVGIPLIVVVTKADLVDSKAAENPLRRVSESKLDAVTRYLRLWCLARGAAMVYTSGALETNCDALRDLIGWRTTKGIGAGLGGGRPKHALFSTSTISSTL